MKRLQSLLGLAAGIALALLLAAIAVNATGYLTVRAQTAQPAQAAAPAPIPQSPNLPNNGSPLVIPGAAFSDDGLDPSGTFFSFAGGYVRGSAQDACIKAPVYLPKHARIYEMYASLYDNNATGDMWARLYRVDNYTGVAEMMGEVASTGQSTAIQSLYDSTITTPDVDYPEYSYYVGTCLAGDTTRLYSVRLWFYKYDVFLPSILNNFAHP